MANPEHLQLLKQGVEAWNQWREQHRDIIPDLSRATFDTKDKGTSLLLDSGGFCSYVVQEAERIFTAIEK